jgi:MoaA/NifB/PqqE/SkfB family radical SAM enzyme
MKIQTMSVVCGTRSCNAKCPFCVSATTLNPNLPTDVNWRNFNIACKLADKAGATTVLLTGKGEPTLHPQLVTRYLGNLENYNFPFIELQTNGMALKSLKEKIQFTVAREETLRSGNENFLEIWYNMGLTTVSLSAVHHRQDMNRKIYGDNYPKLEDTVKLLHDIGFSVRLSIMMMKGYVDTLEQVNEMYNFCQAHRVEQLTIRPIAYPEKDTSDVSKWIKEHTLDANELLTIEHFLIDNATKVLTLSHGAIVYDYCGQNICLSNCLTTNETDDNIRQIIFYPNGTIGYDWCYRGAVLL